MENKLKVERIRRDGGIVEYRMTVGVAYMVDPHRDGPIPDRFISGLLANRLREYVTSAVLDENVQELIEQKRSKNEFTCPCCGKVVSKDE